MRLPQIAKKLLRTPYWKLKKSWYSKTSYAQCGEDIIVDFIFWTLGKKSITYLDIGAHHPNYLSNTFLFYKKGSKGICVEADPVLAQTIEKKRPRDIVLNIGASGNTRKVADFYVLSEPGLSTFSKEEAEQSASYGTFSIQKVLQIPVLPINEILRTHFTQPPDFISLDIEGLDLEIVENFDFTTYRPLVWCIETLTYAEDKGEKKIPKISEHMLRNGYFTYADTYINTIFVDTMTWRNRSK
jgi:FkbM family methyltransferase